MNWFNQLNAKTRSAAVIAAAALSTLAGLPVHAASSFPDNPLMTGGAGVPPNILLILDDSGSMASVAMNSPGVNTVKDRWGNKVYDGEVYGTLSDDPIRRSYINNSIYYNPNKTYKPWRTSSTDLSSRLAEADYRDVGTHATSPAPSFGNRLDLRGSEDSVFYVPKSGTTSPDADASHYDRYWISNSGEVVIGRPASSASMVAGFPKGPLSWTMDPYTQRSFVVSVPSDVTYLVAATSGGGRKVELNLVNPWNQVVCTQHGDNASEQCSVDNPMSGNWTIQVFRYYGNNGNGDGKFTDVTLSLKMATPVAQTPTGRTQAAELQNFANWYQYARTRTKTAKAGASEAFGQLNSQYRVGFDTIWNRGGSGGNTSGDSPNFPIPYGTNDGQFSGTNRDTFYSRLQGAGANDGTPLKGALQRAARYFMTDEPWMDSSGSRLSCRQNYALLTTDGYWNSNSGYTNVNNADSGTTYGDSYSNTLADVAYRYWKDDLKSDLPNNVRTSTADPASWQHMVTFGISIGLQGTLNPNNPPPNPWNVDPTTNTEDERRIDDLWHASLNGHGRFVVASDPDSFKDALTSALAAIDARSAAGSNIASTSTKTDTTTLTFVAGFTSSTWLGDMVASPFNAAMTGVSDTPIWRMSKTFATGAINENFSTRTILTSFGGTAQLFSNLKGNSANAAIFARTTGGDAVTLADNIDYLSGVKTNEVGQSGGGLRQRAYPFGDIVDSSPAYASDTNTVYIGANDGMLHGINAANGKVLFSYVPRGLDFNAMASLSSTAYSHRYFVDGQLDVNKREASLPRNILVAALGRGGKGVFALDVTTPTSMNASKVMWDYSFKAGTTGGVSDDDMGYVMGPVRIRKANDGNFYALVPNGVESTSGQAVLFVYRINSDGSLGGVTKLGTGAGGSNGMMNLGLADLNQDGMIDYVYGVDLKGNVWKWDFSTATIPSSATKLFQAVDSSGNPQAITGGVGLARDSNGRIFLGFGTGKYIASSDVPNNAGYVAQTQTLYGIIDDNTLVTRTDLQARSIPYVGVDSRGRPARGFENYSQLASGKKGWYLDLGVPSPAANGERVVTSPTVVNSAMFISSIIPAAGSDCSGALGSGYVNVINIFSGTSPGAGSFFADTARLTGSDVTTGVIGSVNIGGGMPTQVNVTSNLATAGNGTGTGDDTAGSASGTGGGATNIQGGVGTPLRVNWREIVNTQN